MNATVITGRVVTGTITLPSADGASEMREDQPHAQALVPRRMRTCPARRRARRSGAADGSASACVCATSRMYGPDAEPQAAAATPSSRHRLH